MFFVFHPLFIFLSCCPTIEVEDTPKFRTCNCKNRSSRIDFGDLALQKPTENSIHPSCDQTQSLRVYTVYTRFLFWLVDLSIFWQGVTLNEPITGVMLKG